MRKKPALVAMVASAALLWVAISAGQDVRPTPGPGPGFVTVKGTVDIGNTPSVMPVQGSQWKVVLAEAGDVRVTNTPTVATASPEFLKPGHRYTVTWPTGHKEAIVIAQLGSGGWTRVEFKASDGRRRWVNLASAQAVEELER